jgi:serine/threonine protein kinase
MITGLFIATQGLFGQVAEGVRYLHQDVKVTHNDIKPDNIVEFIGGEIDIPRVCLIDFGHSQFTDPKRRRPGVFGTAEYMAPEVYNNKSRYCIHNGTQRRCCFA